MVLNEICCHLGWEKCFYIFKDDGEKVGKHLQQDA